MKSELIALLESFGFPVFLQGSLNSVDDYLDSFFTFWNFENREKKFYDNLPNCCIYGFWVYFYSVNPVKVQELPEQAVKLLKKNGWIIDSRPLDIQTDAPTHTGAFFRIYYLKEYEEES